MSQTNILEFQDLYYDVKNKDKDRSVEYVNILRGITGKIESGKLTGIMGNSGCGKTHFLKILFGDIESNSKTYGEIRYNGIVRNPESWTKLITYLPQDDYFYPELTVYDSLVYYLSLNTNTTKDLHNTAMDILKKSQIVDKKDALMSSLSGGERKRAMVALTLSNEPEILILDEPTSGLDSNSALNIVYNLKKYAVDDNKMVIFTVHQPGKGIFNLIDDLLFMTPDGLFYSGPVSKISEFLEKFNLINNYDMSTSEFLFFIQGNDSPYIEKVSNILSCNNDISLYSGDVSICNNTKLDLTDLNFYHVYRILLHNIKIAWGQTKMINFVILIFCIIYLGFKYSVTDDDLLIIESDDTFSKTFLKSFYFFMPTTYYLLFFLNSSPGFDARNDACFKIENFTGKYSFLTYFVYLYIQKFVYLISILTLILISNIFYITSFLKYTKIFILIYLLNILYTILIIPIFMLTCCFPISERFVPIVYFFIGMLATFNPGYKYLIKKYFCKNMLPFVLYIFNLFIIFPTSNLDILIYKYLISNKIVTVSPNDFTNIEADEIYQIFDFPVNDTILLIFTIISYFCMVFLVWKMYKNMLLSNYRLILKKIN